MTDFKIVASDLDGTLLNNSSKISRENLSAITELSGKGVHFVPSTGRTYSEIPDELKSHPNVRYIIHSNGSVVFDKLTGDRLLTCIPLTLCRKILDILDEYKTHITIRCNGECFVDANCQSDKDFEYYNIYPQCPEHRTVVLNFAVHLENFRDFSYSADNTESVSVFFNKYEDKLACRARIEQLGDLRVVEVSEYNIEIVNINAGKGNALYLLADMLGIDRSSTISIGDSDNDSSITQAAGLGLAVSNACPALKNVADEIICSNEEHAVLYVLNHYFS